MSRSSPKQPAAPEALLPLSAAVCSILVALADGEKHGYAIMQAVAEETGGAVPMGPGTLYGTLDRMLGACLVTECDGRADPTPHAERRRYYKITDFGDRVLCAELARLRLTVEIARRKNHFGTRVSPASP